MRRNLLQPLDARVLVGRVRLESVRANDTRRSLLLAHAPAPNAIVNGSSKYLRIMSPAAAKSRGASVRPSRSRRARQRASRSGSVKYRCGNAAAKELGKAV